MSKDIVKELVSGLPRAFIKGKGTGSGTVEIVGFRKRDKKLKNSYAEQNKRR